MSKAILISMIFMAILLAVLTKTGAKLGCDQELTVIMQNMKFLSRAILTGTEQ